MHRLRAQVDANLRRGPRGRERAQHAEKNDEYSFSKSHDSLQTTRRRNRISDIFPHFAVAGNANDAVRLTNLSES
jgi:hypothetical protein